MKEAGAATASRALSRSRLREPDGIRSRNIPLPGREAAGSWTPPSLPGLEFPGCEAIRMTRSDMEACEGRLEFWDADSATAWVAEPPSPAHELPSHSLAALAERIAAVRGSPITCLGSMGLLVRDAEGASRRMMQADQSLYLRPLSANLPRGSAMVVGEHDFPDVVLEVDHTTDARRGKLKLYGAWGFPELWIQVPAEPSPSRPKSRLPGLTIHLLEGDTYREAGESRAFPGWRAEEIHAALGETARSAETVAVLERVGAALGGREGTGPDDDPLLRSQRAQGMEQGIKQGIEQGTEQGIRQGIEQGLAAQREMLRRQAELKFGAAAASEFVRRLEAVADPALLAEAGERIVTGAAADELLSGLNPVRRLKPNRP